MDISKFDFKEEPPKSLGEWLICRNCKFWAQDESDDTFGACHRYAPRNAFVNDPRVPCDCRMCVEAREAGKPTKHDLMAFAKPVHTFYNYWCGDFQEQDPSI